MSAYLKNQGSEPGGNNRHSNKTKENKTYNRVVSHYIGKHHTNTTLDQRFFTSEFLSWDLLKSEGTGTFFATVALIALLSYEEVERCLRYTGPRGIRNLIFPDRGSCRNIHLQMSKVLKKARSSLSRRTASSMSVGSAASDSSDDSRPGRSKSKTRKSTSKKGGDLPPPVLVYHESARSIVFRDHLRRAAVEEQQQLAQMDDSEKIPIEKSGSMMEEEEKEEELQEQHIGELADMSSLFFPDNPSSQSNFMGEKVEIQGYQPNIVPLPHLDLGPSDEFSPFLESDGRNKDQWTPADTEVVKLIESQKAVFKTIKNPDWTTFLRRFKAAEPPKGRYPDNHNDIGPHEGGFPFNSFVTSTSLLPKGGKKMRCFGAANVYTTGVIFALPEFPDPAVEDEVAEHTRTWTWPSGYAAKTEFNIDSRGNLINGRQEAIIPLSGMRKLNEDYLNKEDYMVAGRIIKGGLKTVPYNEIFVRVGGRGRIVNGKDCATGETRKDDEGTGRSFDKGVGLPVALFVRTATFGHLISLIRTRARLLHLLGESHVQGIPLLMVTPELGVRVLTEKLQRDLLKIAAKNLNPFQNPLLEHKTKIDDTDEKYLETKLEELIDLDETIRETLTPEECVRLAGGFGATDESIAQILKDAMIVDKESQKNIGDDETESHRLQDIVNEGLTASVRSGDYYTSRQLLILYSLVASEGHQMDIEEKEKVDELSRGDKKNNSKQVVRRKSSLDSEAMLLKRQHSSSSLIISNQNSRLPPPPPPPPLDTDRLRSATNSDGLLAVLGAAQVLKAMRDGSAKKRTEESFLAVEEYVISMMIMFVA